jgi:hypothetical protein
VFAMAIALFSVSFVYPNPSRINKTNGFGRFNITCSLPIIKNKRHTKVLKITNTLILMQDFYSVY